MYVAKLHLENVRGFGRGASAVDLDLARSDGAYAGWTVVAGRNGAGKSTLLRAVALSLAGPVAARSLQDSFAGWIHRGAASGSVETCVEYAVEDRFQEGGRIRQGPFWTGLRWQAASGGPEPKVEADLSKNKSGAKAPSRGPWADNPLGWLVCGYGPFRRLSGEASPAQRLMSGPRRLASLVTLFREDASLVESVEWLKSVYLRAMEKKPGFRELQTGLVALLNDGLLPDEARATKIDSDGLWVEQGGTTLPLEELSDGYRTAAALVLDIAKQMFACFGQFTVKKEPKAPCTVDLPAVVLIDEIDVHLHVSWQQRIGFWLKEHFPRVQFLVTTHSPFICQAADDRGLIRLPGNGSPDPAQHVDLETFRRVVNGTADQAVLTALFGLDRTRSDRAERLRKEYGVLRAKEMTAGLAKTDQKRLALLQQELPFVNDASESRGR